MSLLLPLGEIKQSGFVSIQRAIMSNLPQSKPQNVAKYAPIYILCICLRQMWDETWESPISISTCCHVGQMTGDRSSQNFDSSRFMRASAKTINSRDHKLSESPILAAFGCFHFITWQIVHCLRSATAIKQRNPINDRFQLISIAFNCFAEQLKALIDNIFKKLALSTVVPKCVN